MSFLFMNYKIRKINLKAKAIIEQNKAILKINHENLKIKVNTKIINKIDKQQINKLVT